MSAAVDSVIDPVLVREVEARIRRDDVELTIATRGDYASIEAASRGADPGDVLTPVTSELVTWFIDENPCGQGFVVIAREPGSPEVVGHFIFYPWALKLRRGAGGVEEAPVSVHVRLWVSSRLRRRGVFLSMTEFGVELLRRLGVGLAYTVPMNERSAPGFLKLGEQRSGYLPLWVRPVVPGWGAIAGGRRDRDLEVERRDAFDESFDGAPDASMPEAASAWSPRRAALLNWRYTARPDFDYEIRYIHRGGRPVGYLVTRRMPIKKLNSLVVCDFWAKPSEQAALRVGIDDALRSPGRARGDNAMPHKRPAIVLAFGGNVAGTVSEAFRRAGLIRPPRALQPPVSIVGGGIGEGEQRIELPSIDGWYATPYDWDVF
jgi:hypothetical protein